MTGYRGMEPDAFIEYLLDEDGLADFVDVQLRGISEREDHHWRDIAHRISHLSQKTWQPSPEYVQMLYALQVERIAQQKECAA